MQSVRIKRKSTRNYYIVGSTQQDRMKVLLALFVTCSASVFGIENFFSGWMKWMQMKKVCYHDLGCFDLSSPWFSWSRPIPVLPQHPDAVDTKFYLLTRNHPNKAILLQTKPYINISESDYDGDKWNFFLVHGFIGHYTDPWVVALADQLLELFDGNVILVDWSKGANIYNYIQAVANTRLVGREMSRFYEHLMTEYEVGPDKMHIFGYSLGAQIAAYVANEIKDIQRITAFDPAQPGFEGADPLVRLDNTDANFVDVVHTNGRAIIGFGERESVGHSDFFVNGGETQPGCTRDKIIESHLLNKSDIYQSVEFYLSNYTQIEQKLKNSSEIQNFTLGMPIKTPRSGIFQTIMDFLTGKMSLLEYVVCSHQRAPQYYIESLRYRNCSYWGRSWLPYTSPVPIESCQPEYCSEMGLHSILFPARGDFYVDTNADMPYCKWHPDVEVPMKNYLADRYLRQIFMNGGEPIFASP